VPNHDVTGCRFGPIPLESSLEVIQMIENAAAHTVTSTDNRFALTVFEKLLAAERRQFGDDDRRVALTLVCVARAHSAAGEYAKADEVYRTALPILKKYEAMMWILSSINPDYFKVLRQVNKQSEIDKIEGRRN